MRADPVVTAIHLAGGHRSSMRSVGDVEVEAGRGIVGDRYHGTRHRHVSIVAQDALDAAAADLGAPIGPGATRRNLTLSHGPVPTLPGTRLRIGGVDLEVVRVAAPCRRMEEVAPGARRALHGRGGAVCRALTSGTIRLGDTADVDVRSDQPAR